MLLVENINLYKNFSIVSLTGATYARQHLKQSKETSGLLRCGHIAIATVEFTPILGILIATIEHFVRYIFAKINPLGGKNTDPQVPYSTYEKLVIEIPNEPSTQIEFVIDSEITGDACDFPSDFYVYTEDTVDPYLLGLSFTNYKQRLPSCDSHVYRHAMDPNLVVKTHYKASILFNEHQIGKLLSESSYFMCIRGLYAEQPRNPKRCWYYYLVTNMVKGARLDSLIRNKALSLPLFLEMMEQVEKCTSILYSKNIIWKDLHSENVFWDDNQLTLIDFEKWFVENDSTDRVAHLLLGAIQLASNFVKGVSVLDKTKQNEIIFPYSFFQEKINDEEMEFPTRSKGDIESYKGYEWWNILLSLLEQEKGKEFDLLKDYFSAVKMEVKKTLETVV